MSCTDNPPVDIDIDQGADVTIPILVGGLSLTSASAEMQARETVASTSTILSLSTTTGEITISGALISVFIDRAYTTLMTKPLVYDLFVTTQDNLKYKILRGKLIPVPSVTR